MASEVLAVEARLKDYISNNLDTINNKLNEFSQKGRNSFNKVSKSSSFLSRAFSGTKDSLINFAKQFGPAAAAVTILTSTLLKIKNTINFVQEVTIDFEKTMSTVKAILVPTADEFDRLNAKAKELGSTTVFTAKQAGDAFLEMGKRGFKVTQTLDAVEGVLDLAAAAQISLSEAASATVATLNQFGLAASESTRVADVMTAAFSKSGLNMFNFTEAMKFVGPIAGQVNVSLEQTTGLLGVLADREIKGSLAATGLRTIFLELANSNSKVNEMLRQNGVYTDDVIKKLEALSKMNLTVTDTTEYFSVRATATAQVILNNIGAAQNLTGALKDVDKYSKTVANTMLDNVAGATTLLKSAQEGLALAIGETFKEAKVERLRVYTKIINKARDYIIQHKDKLQALANVAQKTFMSLIKFGKYLCDMFKSDFADLAESVLTLIKVIFGYVKDFFSTFKEPIVAALKFIRDAIKTILQVVNYFAKTITALFGLVKTGLLTLVEYFFRAVEGIGKAINWISKKLKGKEVFDLSGIQEKIEKLKASAQESADKIYIALSGNKAVSALEINVDKAKKMIKEVSSLPILPPIPPTIPTAAVTPAPVVSPEEEIKILEEKLAANKFYQDLIIQNMQAGIVKEKAIAKLKREEDYAQAQQWHDKKIIDNKRLGELRIEIKQQYEDKITEIEKSGIEEHMGMRIKSFEKWVGLGNTLTNQLMGFLSTRRRNDIEDKREEIERWHKAETEKIKSSENTEDAKKKLLERVETEKQAMLKKANEENKKRAIAEKALMIAQATAATALGVTTALSSWTSPVSKRIAEAAIIGTAGALQIATIAAQRMQHGGIVGGATYTGDKIPIMANSGEMMLNREQQANLFNMVKGGGNTTNNTSALNLTINIPTGTQLDSNAVDQITDSMEKLNETLLQANENGYLETFKSSVGL